MDWWTEVRLATAGFLDQHGLVAGFVFLLIEEAGVPVPVPGDFLMLILGIRARQGQVPLWQAILAMEVATILGATFLYAVSAWAGRGLVYRYGRFIRLSPESLDRAERWLRRHGLLAVFVGRLVPGLRIVTAVACGVFSVSPWVFLPAMSLGALLYIVVYTLLGYFLGAPVLDFLEHLQLPMGLLGSLVLLTILLVWTARARRALRARRGLAPPAVDHQPRIRAGAMAGALATIASTLLMNVLVNVAGNLAFRAPGTLIEQTATQLAIVLPRDVGPALLFVAGPAFVAVGVWWGAAYGGWAERWLSAPDWCQGVIFAAVPLSTSLLVVMPLLGLGLLGMAVTGPVAVIGEAVRHAAYGAVLGLSYPVLLARRRVRLRPHTPAELAPTPDLAPSAS
jgi:membrane protein DedA with SNARE-associated domain